MSVANYFLNFALQMLFTVGFVFLFGKVIALCNAKFYSNFGGRGRTVCYVTGFIGTPVHECSHALMCLIFGHKITEIKFFSFDSTDGVLGYVRHSYNRKSLYQRIGNLFIGVAPVVVGALILAGLLYLLLPQLFSKVWAELSSVNFLTDTGGSFRHIWRAFVGMFSYMGTWQFWVFVLIGSLIALHMTLSRADISGALSGLAAYVAIFLVADLVLAIIGHGVLAAFTGGVLVCGTFLFYFFCIFIVIALVLLALSFIIRAVRRARIGRR